MLQSMHVQDLEFLLPSFSDLGIAPDWSGLGQALRLIVEQLLRIERFSVSPEGVSDESLHSWILERVETLNFVENGEMRASKLFDETKWDYVEG